MTIDIRDMLTLLEETRSVTAAQSALRTRLSDVLVAHPPGHRLRAALATELNHALNMLRTSRERLHGLDD